jgi:endonuclease YncB( thermonuclease family)
MMSYRIVKGRFRLYFTSSNGRRTSSQPDGDSMWFEPDAPSLLEQFERDPSFNRGGCVQLRLEGIDALELHYEGNHQLQGPAAAARDALLHTVGFTDVEYVDGSPLKVRRSVPEAVPGYVLVSGIDTHGRPISFAYAGTPDRPDGWRGPITVSWMEQSLNAGLLEAGLVYPAFYSSLGGDLQAALAAGAARAASGASGLWPLDRTIRRTRIEDVTTLEKLAIWPKLFRRLVSFFGSGHTDVRGFVSWLRDRPRERDDAMRVRSSGEPRTLSDVVRVTPAGFVRMTVAPLDLVVTPR